MKSSKFLLTLVIVFLSVFVFAQGSGKVNLHAKIEASNDQADMQVSVVDLVTKNLLQRAHVSTNFFYSLPVNQRVMVHFKKSGHPTTRLIIDTNVPVDAEYNITFALNLKDLDASMETGISLSAGTISYSDSAGGFVLAVPQSGKANLCKVTYSGTTEPAKF